MRLAFTLVELLVIIAIIGVMTTVGVVNIFAGKGAARVKGATRDIFAAIRHARSTALVTSQPVIITYSTEEEDGTPLAKVEITSAKLFSSETDRSKVQTLSGEPLPGVKEELVHIEEAESKSDKDEIDPKTGEAVKTETTEGASVEEILFAPIDDEIVRGMRLKVVKDEDEALETGATGRKNKISVFSNVDYLIGRYKDSKAKSDKKTDEKEDAGGKKKSGNDVKADIQEPVSIAWEANGRVDPHRVWIYADGQKPEDGMLVKIDRFGAAKVISGDGRDDD